MRIQSKFKDYYDHISHVYGGDPDVIYLRSPLKTTEYKVKPLGITTDHCLKPRCGYNLGHLVVGSKALPVIFQYEHDEDKAKYGLFVDTLHIELFDPVKYPFKHGSLIEKYSNGPEKIPDIKVKELVQEVGAPVFFITSIKSSWAKRGPVSEVSVEERIPILKDVKGFTSVYPASQVWQEIYATLTNVLRKNPDKEPPVRIANNDRIHAAGFDLKTSFRNPINPRNKKVVKKAKKKAK